MRFAILVYKGKRGKGEWSGAKASGLRASRERASEARASEARWRGEEQEKGDEQRFPLPSSSSKLLRFFSKSDSFLYWYLEHLCRNRIAITGKSQYLYSGQF